MKISKRAVALGLFDGVHLGHRAVIAKSVEMAEKGYIPSVYTFACDTLKEKQGRIIEYIYADSFKEELIRGCGIEDIIFEDFSKVKNLDGEDFVRDILKKELGTGFVTCGQDFRFGRNASCGIAELSELCRIYGIGLGIAEDVTSDGENISSRRIRELLSDGNMAAAAELLGKSYIIRAEVVHGKHLGHTLGFPTINQQFADGQIVPRFGVYRTDVVLNGKTYAAVTDIGVKPTISGDRSPLAETHILGFSGDIYGERVDTLFRKFIRPEMKFKSLDELKAQISEDTKEALEV